MCSLISDLVIGKLPLPVCQLSQLQSITGLWPLPHYTACWQRHACEQRVQSAHLKVERSNSVKITAVPLLQCLHWLSLLPCMGW